MAQSDLLLRECWNLRQVRSFSFFSAKCTYSALTLCSPLPAPQGAGPKTGRVYTPPWNKKSAVTTTNALSKGSLRGGVEAVHLKFSPKGASKPKSNIPVSNVEAVCDTSVYASPKGAKHVPLFSDGNKENAANSPLRIAPTTPKNFCGDYCLSLCSNSIQKLLRFCLSVHFQMK